MTELITTWRGIANFVKLSIRTVQRHKKELRENGIIFYRMRGRPPHREVAGQSDRLIEFFSRLEKQNQERNLK